MKPIYEPKGKAKEYGDYAINIYTGCPHRCYYCFAPNVLHRDREVFHSHVQARPGIVDAVKAQLEREQISGKLIHLCFTCDPYPMGYDWSTTREIIKILKKYGNHVQILTKGDGSWDLDLLDSDDWYGVSISSFEQTFSMIDGVGFVQRCPQEPKALNPYVRIAIAESAKRAGINTWLSLEPVVDEKSVLEGLACWGNEFDKVKIGKLNYHPSSIDWAEFGKKAEQICKTLGVDYYIKDSLRAEMEEMK